MLLHIGLHKTATTWLQKHLFQDPAIGFTSLFTQPELESLIVYPPVFGFDAQAMREEIRRRAQEAEVRGLYPVITHERFSGSPESGGYDSQYLAERLKQIIPEARVLIVIREQKSMILSFYKQYIWTGGHLALKHYLYPPNSPRPEAFIYEQLAYDRLIAYYQKLYGQENVCVLPFELFRQSAHDYVSAIAQFCNRPFPDDAPVTEHYQDQRNKSLTPFQTRVTKHINFWFGTHQRFRHGALPLLDFKQVKNVRRFTHRIERRLPQRYLDSLGDKAVREIAVGAGDRYRASNAETMRLTGLDLKQYGYDLPR